MNFRREGKTLHDKRRDWAVWLDTVSDLVRTAGLPRSVIESEDAWSYLVDKTYSQAGYLAEEPWFSIETMSAPQRAAFWELLCRWVRDRAPESPDHQLRSFEATYKWPIE
jgi:hypothetical protein